MPPCSTRLIASIYAEKTTAITITAASPSVGRADGLEPPVVSGRPRSQGPLVNDRNLDGGDVLCLSVGREWREDRAATAATYALCNRRRRHADIHGDGDGIFGHDGVSDQRSDSRDCGGQPAPHPLPHPKVVPFTALHTYYCRRPVRTATASQPRRPGRRQTTRSTVAMLLLPRQVHIRTCKNAARSAIARRLRAASTGPVASTSPRCSAAALTSGHAILPQRPIRAGTPMRIQVTSSNWAVEGWYVNTGAHDRAFEAYACSYSGGMKHHIAFINDISANNLMGCGHERMRAGCAQHCRPKPRWNRLRRRRRNDRAELGPGPNLSRRD